MGGRWRLLPYIAPAERDDCEWCYPAPIQMTNGRAEMVLDRTRGPPPPRSGGVGLEVWVAAGYAIVAVTWMVVNEAIPGESGRSVSDLSAWFLLKAAGFVAVTSIALHEILRWAFARERRGCRPAQASDAATREREDRYRSIFESSGDAIVATDRAGRFTEVNPAALRMLGYTREEMLQRTYREITPARWHASEEESLRRVPARGYSDEYEKEYVRKDGTVVPVSVRAFIRKDAAGNAAGAWGIVRDMTERKLAQEKLAAEKNQLDETLRSLREMQAQLIQADRMASVGMLAAGVAHEINNPLAYLNAALEFLDREMKDLALQLPPGRLDELSEALADAREGASRVKHVVRDLKAFSRGDEERRSTLDLVPVIESSVNMVFNEIKYRARLVKEFGKTPPVFANEARLCQVFLNLLVNAAQAIPEGHVDRNEIRIVTRTDEDGRAVVEVRDTGPGIAPDVVGRIFDAFFTTKPQGVGTGLGLSICHDIVASVGGEIAVETRLGHGAVFRVALPAAPDHVDGDGETGPEPLPHAPTRRGRVLVVDDEPAICAAIRRLLAPEHDVVAAERAREALDLVVAGERFDAILCDVMMADMTGMELHGRLSAAAPSQAERMILLTGGAFTPGATEFLQRVPNARLEKPFDPASVLALVRGLVC
jgi:PAS domain S-box-containing protein